MKRTITKLTEHPQSKDLLLADITPNIIMSDKNVIRIVVSKSQRPIVGKTVRVFFGADAMPYCIVDTSKTSESDFLSQEIHSFNEIRTETKKSVVSEKRKMLEYMESMWVSLQNDPSVSKEYLDMMRHSIEAELAELRRIIDEEEKELT